MPVPTPARERWDAITTPSITNALIAAVIALILAGVAFTTVTRQTPVYQSTAIMLLDQPAQIAKGSEGTVVKLNLLRQKYAAILTTTAVMRPAATKAGVPLGLIRSSQSPTFPALSLTLYPVVRSGDPLLARRMAQATAEALSDYVAEEQDATGLDSSLQLSLRIIEDARPGIKVTPQRTKARQSAIVAGVAGLLLGYVGLQLGSAKYRR